MTFRLLINKKNMYQGESLLELFRRLDANAKASDVVEIFHMIRGMWFLTDIGIYPFAANVTGGAA